MAPRSRVSTATATPRSTASADKMRQAAEQGVRNRGDLNILIAKGTGKLLGYFGIMNHNYKRNNVGVVTTAAQNAPLSSWRNDLKVQSVWIDIKHKLSIESRMEMSSVQNSVRLLKDEDNDLKKAWSYNFRSTVNITTSFVCCVSPRSEGSWASTTSCLL